MSQQAVHRFNAIMRTTKRRRGEWIYRRTEEQLLSVICKNVSE
jgi:hypothetical protein